MNHVVINDQVPMVGACLMVKQKLSGPRTALFTHTLDRLRYWGGKGGGGARLKRAALHGVCDKRRVSNTTGR